MKVIGNRRVCLCIDLFALQSHCKVTATHIAAACCSMSSLDAAVVPPPASASLAYPTIELTSDPLDAPRVAQLEHAICLPCRFAGSRCEGHIRATISCLQCVKRGDRCLWRLARNTKPKWDRQASIAESEEDDESDASEDSAQREPKRVKRERSYSAHSRRGGRKAPVPSAGWPARQDLSAPRLAYKRRVVKKEDHEEETDAVTDGNRDGNGQDAGESSNSADDEAQRGVHGRGRKLGVFPITGLDKQGQPVQEHELLGQMLAHFGTSDKGENFLHLASYKSLMASIFAQDSADLAKCLFWWQDAGPAIRQSHLHPTASSDEEWQAASQLAQLLAENAHTWDLWPRLPAYPDASTDAKSLSTFIDRGQVADPKPNMSEEIAGIALRQLAGSTLFENVNASIGPLHMEAYIDTHVKHNIPFQRVKSGKRPVQRPRSTYAPGRLSAEQYRSRYLNKEDMILDHVDTVRIPVIRETLSAVDKVLMMIADNRKPQPTRRSRPSRRVPENDSGQVEGTSEVKKGKQRAVDKDEVMPLVEEEPHKPQKRKKEPQPPGDWRTVVLAAASVPGLPRR